MTETEFKIGQIWLSKNGNEIRKIVDIWADRVAYSYLDKDENKFFCTTLLENFKSNDMATLLPTFEFPKEKKTVLMAPYYLKSIQGEIILTQQCYTKEKAKGQYNFYKWADNLAVEVEVEE